MIKWLVFIFQILIIIYSAIFNELIISTLICMMAAYTFISLIYVFSKEEIVTPIKVKYFSFEDISFIALVTGMNFLIFTTELKLNFKPYIVVALFLTGIFIKSGVKNDS